MKSITSICIFSLCLLLGACNGGSSSSSGSSTQNSAQSSEVAAAVVSASGPATGLWRQNMIDWGRTHCARLTDESLSLEDRLGATYYDSIWVYQQIRDFTQDSSWEACIAASNRVYRDYFVLNGNGKVPGYWIFPHGLENSIARKGDARSQEALEAMVDRAAFANPQTPLEWTLDQELSREVAYNILSYLSARRLGLSYPEGRLQDFVLQAYGHIAQWTSGSAAYVRPFMVAITAQALIEYQQGYGDPAVVPAIKEALDYIWRTCWIESAQTFQYTNREHSTGGTEPAPDLNLLIAPAYMWLYLQTGEDQYFQQAEKIFTGGVTQAWLGNPKQFNQNYRWSFQYMLWRQQAVPQ